MTHLKNLLVGLGSVMNPFGTAPNYIRPAVGDRAKDLSALAGDMRATGADLRQAIKKASGEAHGQSKHYSTGARKG